MNNQKTLEDYRLTDTSQMTLEEFAKHWTEYTEAFAAHTETVMQEGEKFLIDLERELDTVNPSDEAPLKLEQAICLHELGGELRRNGVSIPSTSVTVSLLRNAIAKGSLRKYRDGKNIYVSKQHVKEWLTACQENDFQPASISKPLVSARAAIRLQRGTSGTLIRQQESQSKSALDSAMIRLAQLKLK